MAQHSLGSRTSYTLTGLRNGTKYYVYLVAVSSGGRSPAATASATTLGTLPPPPPVTFGAGTYRVGIDIPAGLSRASGSSDPTTWCYWERLSGFSGSFDDIIANDFIDAPIPPFYVQILPSRCRLLHQARVRYIHEDRLTDPTDHDDPPSRSRVAPVVAGNITCRVLAVGRAEDAMMDGSMSAGFRNRAVSVSC